MVRANPVTHILDDMWSVSNMGPYIDNQVVPRRAVVAMFPSYHSYPPDPSPSAGRSSLSSCLTRQSRPRRDLEVSWDASVLDRPSDTHADSPRPNLVSLARLARCSFQFCVRLRALVDQAISLYQLAVSNRTDPDHSIQVINRKLKPGVVELDEDMLTMADEIKYNVDLCTIDDPRLVHLLNYNAILDDIHSLLEKMIKEGLDLLEQHLNRLDRGALGFPCPHKEIQFTLGRIAQTATQMQSSVREEMDRWERLANDYDTNSTPIYR